jgi:hypothetical protein
MDDAKLHVFLLFQWNWEGSNFIDVFDSLQAAQKAADAENAKHNEMLEERREWRKKRSAETGREMVSLEDDYPDDVVPYVETLVWEPREPYTGNTTQHEAKGCGIDYNFTIYEREVKP